MPKTFPVITKNMEYDPYDDTWDDESEIPCYDNVWDDIGIEYDEKGEE